MRSLKSSKPPWKQSESYLKKTTTFRILTEKFLEHFSIISDLPKFKTILKQPCSAFTITDKHVLRLLIMVEHH